MREKVFALGDDYWVENDAGDRTFKVDGKVLRLRNTFVLEDPSGAELYKVQKKLLKIRDTMGIERGGQTVATVKKRSSHRSGSDSRSVSKAARTWRWRQARTTR
jgi:uncharacterized protein YxjI